MFSLLFMIGMFVCLTNWAICCNMLEKCWWLWELLLSKCQDCLGKDKSPNSFYQPEHKYTLSDYIMWCRQTLWYRLRDEGLRRRHSGGQATQEELGSIGNQKGKTERTLKEWSKLKYCLLYRWCMLQASLETSLVSKFLKSSWCRQTNCI